MSDMPPATAGSSDASASIHRIVVGIDRSDQAKRALAWAASQAGHTGAVLEIHTAHEPGYAFVTHDEIHKRMDRLVAEAAAR